MKRYYVYIMSNQSRTLYVGFTSDLERRVRQHKSREIAGFTAKYNVTQLVFYEGFADVNLAIAWEKRLKGWGRAKKVALIEEQNPHWEDRAAGWFASDPPAFPAVASWQRSSSNRHPERTREGSGTEHLKPDPSRVRSG